MGKDSIWSNNIRIQQKKELESMMKHVLDQLWQGARVTNRIDGYWYVRLADVSRAIEDWAEKDKDIRYRDQEWSQDNWNRTQKYYDNPNSLQKDENDKE